MVSKTLYIVFFIKVNISMIIGYIPGMETPSILSIGFRIS